MKLIIKKSNYEQLNSSSFKGNLLDVCKWLNFVEDTMHVQFPSDRITMNILIEDDFTAHYMYMKNGAYYTYHRLPMNSSFYCYCSFDRKARPISFDYVSKNANILNRFILGVMFLRHVETVEIDTRKYKC